MIEGEQFINIINKFYSFLETDFSFIKVNETINGNAFYNVEFKGKEKIASISYENIEDYLTVIIFLLQNNQLPNYDDKTRTLHLDKLNKETFSFISSKEINENNDFFSKHQVSNHLEKELLKSAK